MKSLLERFHLRLNLKACGGFLLAMVVLTGVGAVHQYFHLEAEEDSATHDPQTCPQCQSLKTLGSEAPQYFDSRICCIEEAEINAYLGTCIFLEQHAVSSPKNRSPPLL